MIQLGVELGLFKAMKEEPERGWTSTELADVIGTDGTLLYRVLRYLFTLGAVRESPDSTYSATGATRWLATDAAEDDVKQNKATNSAVFEALPVILQRQQGQLTAATGSTATPPPQSATSQIHPDGAAVSAFVAMMSSRRQNPRTWMDAFPMQLLRLSGRDFGSGRISFVHIDRPTEQQCVSLRNRFPVLLSGMVLQVTEALAARVNSPNFAGYGAEVQVHDSTEAQSVTGAKAYYLKNVLRDFPGEKCDTVLQHLGQACAGDSMVLIDEILLPADDPQRLQIQPGLRMLPYLAATERRQEQWADLLTRGGLRLSRVCTYDEELGDSVIIAVPL